MVRQAVVINAGAVAIIIISVAVYLAAPLLPASSLLTHPDPTRTSLDVRAVAAGQTQTTDAFEEPPLYHRLRYLPFILFIILAGIGSLALFKKRRIFRLAALGAGWVFYAPVFCAIMQISISMALLYGGWVAWFYLIWYPLLENPLTAWIVRGRVILEWWALQVIQVILPLFLFIGASFFVIGLAQIVRAELRGKGLVKNGLYSIVRHPQYLGITLFTFAFVLLGFRPIDFIAWVTLVFLHLLLAESEERKLVKRFGEEYLIYRQEVSFLIPLPSGVRRLCGKLPQHGWRRAVFILVAYLAIVAILLSIFAPFVALMR